VTGVRKDTKILPYRRGGVSIWVLPSKDKEDLRRGLKNGTRKGALESGEE